MAMMMMMIRRKRTRRIIRIKISLGIAQVSHDGYIPWYFNYYMYCNCFEERKSVNIYLRRAVRRDGL